MGLLFSGKDVTGFDERCSQIDFELSVLEEQEGYRKYWVAGVVSAFGGIVAFLLLIVGSIWFLFKIAEMVNISLEFFIGCAVGLALMAIFRKLKARFQLAVKYVH